MIYKFTPNIELIWAIIYIQYMNIIDVYKRIKPSVIALAETEEWEDKINFNFFASGVCVDPSGIFITAKHCVTEQDGEIKPVSEIDFTIVRIWLDWKTQKFTALYINPKTYVVKVSQETDLAFIKAMNKEKYEFPYIKCPSSFNINEGQEVWAAGYPLAQNSNINTIPNLFSGIISRIDFVPMEREGKTGIACKDVILDMSLHLGNSGGPVINSDGKLIAIVSEQELRNTDSKNDKYYKKVWTNLIHCVPYTEFKDEIEKIKKS